MKIAACLVLLSSSIAFTQRGATTDANVELLREAQQFVRQNKLDDALAKYEEALKANPASVSANNGAGVVLDLLGRGADAKKYFAKAIDAAAAPEAKANAERAMAMSYAFDNDCANARKHEERVYEYYVSIGDFYNQGEMLNEAARVCIEAGDFDAAASLYRRGHDAGLKEPNISPDRVALWNFRLEHALGRLAARRHQPAEAKKHVEAARAILDANPSMARDQAIFYPYLTGYVAFYSGDYKTALADFQQANQSDPFIQVLTAQTYDKLGDAEHARELYRKAAATTAHNPPAAFARPFATKKLS